MLRSRTEVIGYRLERVELRSVRSTLRMDSLDWRGRDGRPTGATADYKTALVEIADRIAGSSVSGSERGDQRAFLRAFRVAYRHLAQSVDGDPDMVPEGMTDEAAQELWPANS